MGVHSPGFSADSRSAAPYRAAPAMMFQHFSGNGKNQKTGVGNGQRRAHSDGNYRWMGVHSPWFSADSRSAVAMQMVFRVLSGVAVSMGWPLDRRSMK